MVDEGGQRCGARIVVVTHRATDAALSETVDALADLDVVSEHQQRAAPGRNQRMSHRARQSPVHQPWPGLIDAYRDRLPGRGRLDPDHPARGRHAAHPRQAALRADRLHGASEGRGAQPDRLVQGPRHDDGRHRGGGPRPEGGAVRVDRQHLGLGGGLRRPGGHHLRGADPAGQDRDGQARAGGHARRQDHSDRRQLRRLPRAGPQADRRLPDGRRW